MSGNFDFPPANDANTAIGNTQARFDALSRNLQRGREDFNSQRETAAAQRQSARQTLTPYTSRRRRITSSRAPPRPPPPLPDPRPSGLSSPAHPRSPDPRLRRQESRESLRRQLDELEIVSQEIRDARRRLDNANSDLNDAHRSVVVDHMFLRQRKRRKLDHDSVKSAGFHSKPYGYFGQVKPVLLRMEIVSCDGGEYQRDPMALYRPDNVLRDDRSVYCTKSSQCNLLLRHQDEIMFTVEKITIKAPENGFTAPLQQGLIFVGYSAESLIDGAKPYRIQYRDEGLSRPRPPRSGSTTPSVPIERGGLTLLESLNDDRISQASQTYRPRLSRALPLANMVDSYDRRRTDSDWSSMREVMQYMDMRIASDQEPDVSGVPSNGEEVCDWPALEPEPGITRAPTPPPFTITAESEDESDGEIGEGTFNDNLPPPPPPPWDSTINRRSDSRGRRPLLADFADNSSDDEARWTSPLLDEPPRPPSSFFARPLRRSTPGRIEPLPATLRGSVVGEPKAGETLLVPNAKFFIGKHRSRIHIKFDPPVSGRFLLLKFFSPQLSDRECRDNIDVQYVAARGYAGPRFFPSVEMQ